MKKLLAATTVTVSALLSVAGAALLLPSAHAEEGAHIHSAHAEGNAHTHSVHAKKSAHPHPEHAEDSVRSHHTLGVVKSVDEEGGRVKLAHDPVPSLDWPGMTMWFSVADKALLENLKPAQKVRFTLVEGEGGKFVVTDITTP